MSSFLGFNVEAGFLEGIVRGFKSSLLTTTNYANLGQCESLEGGSPSLDCSQPPFLDFKLQLAATDYGNFLQNDALITSNIITEKARDRLIADFKYLRANSNNPVSGFLDYLTYITHLKSLIY